MSEPSRSAARSLTASTVLWIAMALWVGSLALPAYREVDGGTWILGVFVLLFGEFGCLGGIPCWYANPVAWWCWQRVLATKEAGWPTLLAIWFVTLIAVPALRIKEIPMIDMSDKVEPAVGVYAWVASIGLTAIGVTMAVVGRGRTVPPPPPPPLTP